MSVFDSTMNTGTTGHPMDTQAPKNSMVCPHSPRTLHLALLDLPQIKMIARVRQFELMQNTEIGTTAQLKTEREDFQQLLQEAARK